MLFRSLVSGAADLGTSPAIVAPLVTTSPIPGILACGTPINSGPQHFVVSAAFAALTRWVRHGKAPKTAPRLEVAAGPPPAIMHDAHGNALGGIRTPQVDVPIATFTGQQSGSILCMLLGTTTPVAPATLASLYPPPQRLGAAHDKSLRRAL